MVSESSWGQAMYVRVGVSTRSPSKATMWSCDPRMLEVPELWNIYWASSEAYPGTRLCVLQAADLEVEIQLSHLEPRRFRLESRPDVMVMELQESVLYQLGFGVALL